MKMIFSEPDTVVAVPEMFIVLSKIMSSGTKNIGTLAAKIIYIVEKTFSLSNLILDAAEKIGSKSSKIADEAEITLDEAESTFFV